MDDFKMSVITMITRHLHYCLEVKEKQKSHWGVIE